VVTTEKFKVLTEQVASSLGHSNLRILVVGHPLGGTDEATILQWADEAVEETIQLLTEPR
jgi:N-acyl-D-aspartate/D-glutamate deacylase